MKRIVLDSLDFGEVDAASLVQMAVRTVIRGDDCNWTLPHLGFVRKGLRLFSVIINDSVVLDVVTTKASFPASKAIVCENWYGPAKTVAFPHDDKSSHPGKNFAALSAGCSPLLILL